MTSLRLASVASWGLLGRPRSMSHMPDISRNKPETHKTIVTPTAKIIDG
jgi:hypothetical protein